MNNHKIWASIFILAAGVSLVANVSFGQSASPDQWSTEKAWKWYQDHTWPCGFNYVPANTISYTEMWMDYSFDPKLIDKELQLAEQVGFNCLRVILPYVVWEHDPVTFKQRLDQFLTICEKHKLKAMLIFFDDCQFGPITDPVYGKQPDVVEGWYANGWTPSPGHGMVLDSSTWPKLENFVTDIIKAHKADTRIFCWDLYNEPTNSGMGDVTIPLVEKVFQWARRLDPIQPLTSGLWDNNRKLNQVILDNSDIITFHNYLTGERLVKQIQELKTLGRPMICTEWLNRGIDSIVITCLPVFYHENVGCMNWGLVNGKTQTDLNWGHQPGDPEPAVWQHDLYRTNHTPYSEQEINLFKFYLRQAGSEKNSQFARALKVNTILPTSEILSQTWRYTTTQPQGDWAASNYDDSQWSQGQGGFGTLNPPGLFIASEWKTDEIWMRKEFNLDSVHFSNPQVRFFHDEDIWVYINGQEVIYRAGWSNRYVAVSVPREKMKCFKTGRNVIAVRCKQTSGAQGVDVGIIDFQSLQP